MLTKQYPWKFKLDDVIDVLTKLWDVLLIIITTAETIPFYF